MSENANIQEINTTDVVNRIGKIEPQLQETGRKIGGLIFEMIDNVIDTVLNPKTR